jgi:hypothetical protein
MCKKSDALLLLVLAFSVVSLLSALLPVSDFDNDGNLDSLITEGLVLLPIFSIAIGLFSLLTSLPATCLIISQIFSTLLVPPPISAK